VEVGDDLHRSIRERPDSILLEQRVSNLFDGIEVKLIGKVSTDGIGVWRVFGRLADVIDRGPAGAGASEDLIEFLCRNPHTVSEIYRKILIEAVDDKIKQMFLFYPIVCFGGLHILSKQTLPLTRCDRLNIDRWAKIEAAYDAESKLQKRIRNETSSDAVQTSVKTITDGHHDKKIIQVDYITRKESISSSRFRAVDVAPDIALETLKERVPNEIIGDFTSDSVSYDQNFEVEFNKTEKRIDPLEDSHGSGTYYDYEYRPVPGGARFEDTNGLGCTFGTPAENDNSSGQVLITAGHCLEDDSDHTLYQPHEANNDVVGQPDDSRAVNEFGFDGGVLDPQSVGVEYDLASDRGDDEYALYDIVGVLMQDSLKDYEDSGVELSKQGITTGTVDGPVTHVSDNNDYMQIEADRAGGDSGGPLYKYMGGSDILIAAIHRGPGETDSHSEGTTMHAIEDRFDVSVT